MLILTLLRWTSEIWRRNVVNIEFYASTKKKCGPNWVDWRVTRSDKSHSTQLRTMWTVMKWMSYWFAVVFSFPPQNNVSMLFKWIFAWLLMPVRIKLCHTPMAWIYLRFKTQKHYGNTQREKKKFANVTFFSVAFFRFISLVAKKMRCKMCTQSNQRRYASVHPMEMFNDEYRRLFTHLMKTITVDFNAWFRMCINKMSSCHFSWPTHSMDVWSALKLPQSDFFCRFFLW